MKDAQQNILMYRMLAADHLIASTVHFLRPETGEQFVLDMPNSFICWYDSEHAVFVPSPIDTSVPPFLTVLDLSNGSFTRYTEEDALYTKYQFSTMVCKPPHAGTTKELFDFESRPVNNGEMTLTIHNNQTGEERILTNPEDGIHDGMGMLSPESKFLIIIQSENPDDLFGPDTRSGGRLSVYDFISGNLVMTIEDQNINSIKMFSRNQRFLYMRGGNIPCVVDILSQTKKCIHAIYNKYPEDEILVWSISADQKYLNLIHWGGTDTFTGNLCFYGLADGDLRCPTDGLDILTDHAVTELLLSPNEDFVAFTYEDSCPSCDWAGSDVGLGVIDRNGKHFTDLGPSNAPHWGGMDVVASWRPFLESNQSP